MFDFDSKHFGSTFQTGRLNGFDIMVMQSSEIADEVIKDMKDIIDNNTTTDTIHLTYDKTDIWELDQYRIEQEIKDYGASKGIYVLVD